MIKRSLKSKYDSNELHATMNRVLLLWVWWWAVMFPWIVCAFFGESPQKWQCRMDLPLMNFQKKCPKDKALNSFVLSRGWGTGEQC